MKNTFLAAIITSLAPILFYCATCSALSTSNLLALTAGNMSEQTVLEYSHNSINIYGCTPTSGNLSGACGGDITSTGVKDRLKETVEKYGIVAINMQIEYGIPWEIPFVHMYQESSMGIPNPRSVATHVEEYGYVNWMGYKYSSNSLYGIPESEMPAKVYHSDGGFASMYENIADMMGSLATDYLRNGNYDSAYDYADSAALDRYDARTFLAEETDKQGRCTGSYYCECGCHVGYLKAYDDAIPIIHEVAAAKGWPDSKTLAKEKNIPKGGKYPVSGDIKKQIDAEPHSLHMDCSGSIGGSGSSGSSGASGSSGSSGSSTPVSGENITWIGDSYSCSEALSIIKKKFSGISFGGSECDSGSYIMSNKGVSDRYGGGSSNPPALTILKRIVDAGELKPYLVMAIGTNAGWDDDEVKEFQKIMSGHSSTKVVFVNVKAKAHLGADDIDTNGRLKKLVDDNDNYYLADWAAAYDDKYFANNSTHPTANGGYDKWVEVIADALASIGDGDNCDCVSGQKIADKAKELAWPEGTDKATFEASGTDAFKSAAKSAGVNDNDDCLNFVKTAVIASGADTDFPTGDSEYQLVDYMNSSSKWKKIDTTSESDLQPGDVLVSAVDGKGFNHIFIYIGSGKVASANLTTSTTQGHYGRIANLSGEWCADWGGTRSFYCVDVPFQVFRLNSSDCGSGEFKFYSQGDPKWKNDPFGSSTIGPSGCGPTSFAMLATELLGKDITPTETAKIAGDAGMYVPGKGSSWQITKTLADHYSLEYEKINASSVKDAISQINQHLQNGWKIHLSGGNDSPIYGGGHYIGIRELTSDGKWLLADSGKAQENSEKPWEPETVMVGVYLDNIHAIRGTSTRSNCDDSCPAGDGGNKTYDSLNREQAQKIADYYNSDAVKASNFIGGSIPSTCAKVNCVSFSLWFVSAFTDASDNGATSGDLVGDGAYIAKTGLPSIGWETGNDPTPFSIFGGSGSSAWSHTGVVVGTEGDSILTIEAAWCEFDAQVMTRPKSYFASGVGILAYPGSHFTPDKSHLGNKSLNEIIGS